MTRIELFHLDSVSQIFVKVQFHERKPERIVTQKSELLSCLGAKVSATTAGRRQKKNDIGHSSLNPVCLFAFCVEFVAPLVISVEIVHWYPTQMCRLNVSGYRSGLLIY